MACEMVIDANGHVVNHDIFQSVINSSARMTYTEVNQILVDQDEAVREKYEEFVPMFEAMEDLAATLRKKRFGRGAFDSNFKEAHILFDYCVITIDLGIRDRLM